MHRYSIYLPTVGRDYFKAKVYILYEYEVRGCAKNLIDARRRQLKASGLSFTILKFHICAE